MTQGKRQPGESEEVESREQSRCFYLLVALGIITTAGYGAINSLSWQFKFDSPTIDRPIIAVLLLFATVFVAYLLAIWSSKRAIPSANLGWLIVGFALLFRLVMLFSYPIQEVDIYRYLWDGEVSAQGVSPFRFAPAEILSANNQTGNRELDKLVSLRDTNLPVAEVLRRVHFGELPTIYPPTSQLVFHAVAISTPDDASVISRVWVMKAWLIGFDLGVLFLLIKLLALCRLPIGLSVIYAWCPLVMKEVANSGHLDTIAVFLSILAFYLFIRIVVGFDADAANRQINLLKRVAGMLLVAVILAAAVGAKLYPVVLAPLIFVGLSRRFGWRTALFPACVFVLTTLVILAPILPSRSNSTRVERPNALVSPSQTDSGNEQPIADVSLVPVVPELISVGAPTDSSLGVTTFLKYWEMNDFIFMVVVENLKLDSPQPIVWFSFAPEGFRQPIANSVARIFSIPVAEAPFLTTRATTALMFLLIALWLAWRAGSQTRDPGNFTGQIYCEAAFLTLAWFWLLLPTQNPWYWMWALPLLPFMRNRAWLAMSGLVLVYYLRFWLDYHFAETPIWGTPYKGTAFFDFVVTWLEYAPWFVWLVAESQSID